MSSQAVNKQKLQHTLNVSTSNALGVVLYYGATETVSSLEGPLSQPAAVTVVAR